MQNRNRSIPGAGSDSRRAEPSAATGRASHGGTVWQTVKQLPNDPHIYLSVMGEWYAYNPFQQPLGSGAMGTVFLGFRCRDRAPVAVKRVIDSYANNPQIRERARLEASLAFRHQNLVEMLGYCEYAPDHGPIFLLSNYVQGEDIDKYVRNFAASPERVEKTCVAICQVLDALDYVHSKDIIHRDIKPSNIMVENGSNVRLMDLGIAKMTSGNPYSQYGFIGTPEYSAPEQVRGDKDGINKTTDIYALGITFYELLAGTNPMACPTEIETLTKQLKEELPSSPMIPMPLMNVIWKATAKNQGDRYQTAMEFKNDILLALQEEPSIWQRCCYWIQEHSILFVGIVAAIAAIAMTLIIIILNN